MQPFGQACDLLLVKIQCVCLQSSIGHREDMWPMYKDTKGIIRLKETCGLKLHSSLVAGDFT